MAFSDEEVRRRLPELDGWEFNGKQLTRLFVLPSFMDAIRFVQHIAEAAERAAHHPDIDIRYDTVRLHLMTHSDHGITDKDFALADEINRAARAG
ncbi:MAG: 4a-hydroxytetrahydrobiopterin dehydratase [Chloroflexota bacterium]